MDDEIVQMLDEAGEMCKGIGSDTNMEYDLVSGC